MSLEKFRLYLSQKSHLSKDRFRHCQQVAGMMSLVARKLGLNYINASICGLLHDFVREKSKERMISILQESDPMLLEQMPPECRTKVYLHGPAAAALINRMWMRDIKSMDVIEAIRQQAGTFSDMAPLSRCLYVCKALVPVNGTSFPMQRDIQQLMMQGKLDEADLLLSMYIEQYYSENEIPIHPMIPKRIEELRKKLGQSSERLSQQREP